MAVLREIVIDALHPAGLARFWAQALDGFTVRDYDSAELARLEALGFNQETDPSVAVDGPGITLFFQQVEQPDVAEPVGHNVARRAIHLDLYTAALTTEVERLTRLGASVREANAGRAVMRDPEGNVFCLVERE